MAVHKRVYRPYDGPLTRQRWRFLVVARYGLLDLVESRVLMAFVVICLAPFLAEAAGIYVANSPEARAVLRLGGMPARVQPEFFVGALTLQGMLSFFLAAWVAPVLVSPDLVNGALPLYLSRSFSRAEYLAGKAVVLLALLSVITWVPCLTLFALQAGLADPDWFASNLRVAAATFVGAWIWILVLTLVGLTLSACIRLRLVASASLFGVFFMGSGFGEAWQAVMHDPWGRLANLFYAMGVVWRALFDLPSFRTLGRSLGGEPDLPVEAAALALLATCGLCLWLLNRRLLAREVVA